MYHAVSFYEAAQQLNKNDKCVSPLIVCASFSIELFIKSLVAQRMCKDDDVEEYASGVTFYNHLYSKSGLHGHGLFNLFIDLPQDIQCQLRTHYNKFNPPCDFETLDQLLEHVSETFITHRYAFEGNTTKLDLTALLWLSEMFKDYVFNKYETKCY